MYLSGTKASGAEYNSESRDIALGVKRGALNIMMYANTERRTIPHVWNHYCPYGDVITVVLVFIESAVWHGDLEHDVPSQHFSE